MTDKDKWKTRELSTSLDSNEFIRNFSTIPGTIALELLPGNYEFVYTDRNGTIINKRISVLADNPLYIKFRKINE